MPGHYNHGDKVNVKILGKYTNKNFLSEAESERLVNAYIKLKSRYIPEIDYRKPETFSYFGSAKKYYEDTIKGIYESYPYDGSKAEKVEWSLSASYLDLYFIEHEYPKAKGHITFDRTGDTISQHSTFPTTDNPQYIEFTGGPHIGTVYDANNNRESNLKIDGSKGNTIEFWLKKDVSSFYSTAIRNEVIFESTTADFGINDHQYGKIAVYLESTNSSTESPISFVYQSGTNAAGTKVSARIGSSDITKDSVGDNQWHHYAITILSDDTSTVTKLYVDGELDSTRVDSIVVGPVDRPFVGSIGGSVEVTPKGSGKLSGSLDEIRFWKEARTEKEIGRFWYSPVHGGTDKDHTNANLGLYYKFNEGITGIGSHDKVVLDYSGRIGNGEIVGWDSDMRSSISAIDQSINLPDSSFKEVGDPIINPSNVLIKDVLEQYRKIGEGHDRNNMASLANSVPNFLHDLDKEGLYADLLQIMASSFDDIFLKVKNLPKIRDFAYHEFFKESGQYTNSLRNNFILGCDDNYLFQFTGNHTKPWVDHILRHFGLVTTEIFPDASLFEMFYERSEKTKFEHDLTEVRNTILSNIHKSLVHIFKTKGTEQSFRNLIRCFGIDQELVRLNAYGKNENFPIEIKPVYATAKRKTISFEGTNYQGTVHHTSSASDEISYIASEPSKKPMSVTSNFYFTKRSSLNQSETNRVSLFGMHSVLGSTNEDDPLKWHAEDSGSFQVYFNKKSRYSPDGYFELSSSAGVFQAVSSSIIPRVYDNTHWALAVRIGKKSFVDFNVIPTGSSNQYAIELIGYEYELDTLKNTFKLSSNISGDDFDKLSKQDKALYLGSHKTNFSGSHLDSSDVRAFGMSAWRDILDEDEIKEYAKNPNFFGRTDPLKISSHDDGENLKRAESLLLRWQFNNLTASNSSNQMDIVDFSAQAGQSAQSSKKYPGLAIDMVAGPSSIQQEFLPVVEYNVLDNLHTSDRVKIKSQELDRFESDSRPITYFYNFEKSMYQVVSIEMINMFASIVGYNNIIGDPVHKYRLDYKGLEKLRERFFRRVRNDMDLDKFVEYYRWIDYSLSNFLNQLIPASSEFGSNIKNVVESHALERNKYQHKIPTLRLSNEEISANAVSIGEFGFNWKQPNDFFENQVEASIDFASSSSVEVSDQDDLTHSNSPDAPFAISFWFNLQNTGSGEQVLLNKSSEYSVKVDDDDLEFTLFSDASNHTTITAANQIGTDWTSVIVTYDGTLDEATASATPRKIYIDGAVASATTSSVGSYSGMTNTSNSLVIGAANVSGSNSFNGRIADIVMITGSELTAGQATEIYNGGRSFDITNFSRYDDVVAWWKMGDDADLAAGSGSIKDYVGNHHGTPSSVTISSETTKVYSHFRDIPASDVRYSLYQAIKTDIPNSLSSTRWKSTPFRVITGMPSNLTTGINKLSHEPLSALSRINNGQSVVVTKDDLDSQAHRVDAELPFTLTSASNGVEGADLKDNYLITNNHLDISITKDVSLKGLFADTHVGGMPHRNVPFGTSDSERPEAYKLDFASNQLTISQTPINKPKSMFFRGVSATRFMNFSNIKDSSITGALGNYQKDYEIVKTLGRLSRNKYLVETTGSWLSQDAAASTHISGVVDFEVPQRTRAEHVITNRFTALGGPETTALTRDRETEEYSVYNTLNYRNSIVRTAKNILSAEPSEKFGYRSGSATQGSIHKINRNPQRFMLGTEHASRFDNEFVQHQIPQSDYQYSWVTQSVDDTVYDFLQRNDNRPYVSKFSLKHGQYIKDFSQETTGTLPSAWSTSNSDKSSIYATVESNQTIEITASAGELIAPGARMFSSENLLISENRLYRRVGTSYTLEYIIDTRFNVDAFAVNQSEDLVASIVHTDSSFNSARAIDIHRSSSGGWVLETSLTGAFGSSLNRSTKMGGIFFSGSSVVYGDLTSGTAERLKVNWFTSSSLGWGSRNQSIINSGTDYLQFETNWAYDSSTSKALVHGLNNIKEIQYNHGTSQWEVYRTHSEKTNAEAAFLAYQDGVVAIGYPGTGYRGLGTSTPVGEVNIIHPDSQTNTIKAPDQDFIDGFGTSIDFSGSYMAIGAPNFDITFNSSERELVSNDKGAAYLYKIDSDQSGSSDWASIQRKIYTRVESPRDFSKFATSLGFTGPALAVETPGEATFLGSFESDSSTHVNIYEVSSSATPVDLVLSGPIISGSSGQAALLFKGDSVFSNEINQLPSQFEQVTGHKFRILETLTGITPTSSEFSIEIEVIEGSTSSSDLSNSVYGLTSSPSSKEKLVLQYKVGSGKWKTSKISLVGSGTTAQESQKSFNKHITELISNGKMEEVHVRIISNIENKDSTPWGLGKISLVNSADSSKSEENLIELSNYRRDVIKENTKQIDVLYFTNGFMSQLSNLQGSSPLGSRPGDHDSGLHWGNGTTDYARSVQLWVKQDAISIADGEESIIAQLAGGTGASYDAEGFYPGARAWELSVEHQSGKIKFIFRIQDDYSSIASRGDYYEVKTISSYNVEEWHHVCVTYDGNGTSTTSGLKIYVDGNPVDLLTNRTSTSFQAIRFHADLKLMLGATDPAQQSMLSFMGKMNYLAQFNKELSQAEVQELYELRNNISENYSLELDPLKITQSSIKSSLAAAWPLNKNNLQIDSSTGYSIYTDIVSGYELVGETHQNSNVTAYKRIAPFSVVENIEKIIGYTQPYEIENYNTLTVSNDKDYLKNTLSPYAHASWVQLRATESPVVRKQRKDNKLTISVRGSRVHPKSINTYYHDLNSELDLTPGMTLVNESREVEVYDEVFVTKKYQPLTITLHTEISENIIQAPTSSALVVSQEDMRDHWSGEETLSTIYNGDIPLEDTRLISMKVSAPNDLTMFSSEELNNKLEMDQHRPHDISDIIQGIRSVASSEVAVVEIGYKEVIYPREVNSFTNRARTRVNFDFYSWRNLRQDRINILSGSNNYGNTLVNIGSTKIFPDIEIDKFDFLSTNEFFVDSRNIDNRFSENPVTIHLTASRWPLDARSNFSGLPSSLEKSYFKQGDLYFTDSDIGTFGEGTLQNDYSVFGMGYNGLYGTPPPAPLYSRRVVQTSGSIEYLAGEAKWKAAEQSGKYPFENSGDTTEKLRRLWQDHSLVPEYRVSDYIEDIVLNEQSNFKKVRDKSDYLQVTGAIYHTSSQEISVGTSFFKTYGTSDFMKYFGMTLDEVKENNLGGAAQLTLKCNAAIKFTPYRGFYPVERTLQIGELFSRGYMPEFSITDERQTAADRTQVTSPEKMVERKIRANLQQSLKPLMAPGILYNSIKSGLAVDYPVFGSTADDTALENFDTAIRQEFEPVIAFDSSLSSLTNITGSEINASKDEGIPRLKGPVDHRITFEDMLDPQRLIGKKIYDNEPHPSASIYYGDAAVTKVFDYPFRFGQLNSDNNQSKLFAGNFNLQKTLDDTLTPYKMAVNNFCAETVNFFLENGNLASLESDQVNPNLVSGSQYKMRVYVKNNSISMYDRHSSFGPAVNEGDILVTQISGTATTNPGTAAFASLGSPRITIAASAIGTGSTNFVLEDSSGSTIKVVFRSGSTGTDITTGSYGPNSSFDYDVSQYGKVYVNNLTSSIDLGAIENSNEINTVSINKLMEVAVNYHRWSGSFGIEANFANNNIRLRQRTIGTAGNTPIVSTGSISSLYPSFPTHLTGGTANSTDYTSVVTTKITVSSSHEYAPFVPPYLDQGAEPYVEISFTPEESRNYSLEEILQGSSYQYVNFKEVPSNASNNDNYKNAMSISASLDLTNFVAYEEDSQDPGTTLQQRKRWVIQTKWETPLLNFKNSSVDALNLNNMSVVSVTGSPWQSRSWNQYLTKSVLTHSENYLTSSTGMWHQYGSILNSNEGYNISIRKVEGVSQDLQLARKVGFLGEDMKPLVATPGKIAEKKEISEAVVAIPFYVDQRGGQLKFFTVKSRLLDQAVGLNSTRKSEYMQSISGTPASSGEYKELREQYLRFYNNPGATGKESIAYQMRMMEKFVFPPQFDYYTYPDLSQKPMMYIFQFNAELTKQDLANIWQNLSPVSKKSGAEPRGSSVYNPEINGIRQDIQYVSNFLTRRHLPWSQRKAFFENDVRWLIFKVKQRAESDLANVKIKSLPGVKNNLNVDQAQTSIKTSGYLEDKKYSYNWPYDYFSLVELIKVEGKVDFLPFGDDGTS